MNAGGVHTNATRRVALHGVLLSAVLVSCTPHGTGINTGAAGLSEGDSGKTGSVLTGPVFNNAVPMHARLPYRDTASAQTAELKHHTEEAGLQRGEQTLQLDIPSNLPVRPRNTVLLTVQPDPGSVNTLQATVTTAAGTDSGNCAVDWGDTHINRVTKRTGAPLTHVYTQPGRHTATLTCQNDGQNEPGTSSQDVRTGPPDLLNFDSLEPLNGAYSSYRSYQEQGFTFTPSRSYALALFGPQAYAEIFNTGPSQGLYTYSQNGDLTFRSIDGRRSGARASRARGSMSTAARPLNSLEESSKRRISSSCERACSSLQMRRSAVGWKSCRSRAAWLIAKNLRRHSLRSCQRL